MDKIFIVLMFVSTTATAHHYITENEKECLTLNVYHEAVGESEHGQFMIMDVVKNRSDSKQFPHNLCDVIKQKKQFSWYNNGWKPAKDKKRLNDIKWLVESYYSGLNVGISRGAMWYHSIKVSPKWSKKLVKVRKVGNHIFYKEK